MKYYFLIALLLLTGCNEEVTSNTVNPINPVPPAQNTSTIFQPNSAIQKTSLINQHQQENTNIYPQNNMQIVVKQSLKALTEPLQQDLLDIMGTELQSVDTNFNGQRITFQYQVWRINKLSVCSQAQLNVMQFSECTQAAKQLFQTMCNDLKKKMHTHEIDNYNVCIAKQPLILSLLLHKFPVAPQMVIIKSKSYAQIAMI